MSRTVLKLALVDLVLLTGLYYVIQDLQWRSSYASSVHYACGGPCSYTPSFSHSILTQFFTMTNANTNTSLTSPPTLDWIQLLVLALVVINVWYGYSLFERRKARNVGAASVPQIPNN